MLFEFFLASRQMFRQDATKTLHCFQTVIQFRQFSLKQVAHAATLICASTCCQQCPWRARQQASALVITHRVYADAGTLSNFTNANL